MKLVMVDTQSGNFGSVKTALDRIGVEVLISHKKEDIQNATALILPGVSAFEHGMKSLHRLGLVELIQHKVKVDKVPILGICLGMQLLADSSTETKDGQIIKGLGLIKGKVEKLLAQPPQFKVPNIGWYDVHQSKEGVLFPENYKSKTFYHVHSFHFVPESQQSMAAYIKYGDQKVTVSLEQDNIFGAQFHPEKSQDAGLDFLQRFIDHTKKEAF